MCYSKELSLISFLFGIFSSTSLILFGKDEYKNDNIAIGGFFIFVSLMQVVEYLIWSDPTCKNGLNKIGSLLGPLLNHFQPIVGLILGYIFLNHTNIVPINIIIFISTIYSLYVLSEYNGYISNPTNLCVQKNDCDHLDWTWKYNFRYEFYFFINLLNLGLFYNSKNYVLTWSVSHLLFLISVFKFNKNIGELWCLMVTGVPLVNLFAQRIIGF